MQDFLREQRIIVEFLPSYSSALNGIEHCWAALKSAWMKLLATYTTNYDRDAHIERDILRLCSELNVTPRLLAHQRELFRKVKEENKLA